MKTKHIKSLVSSATIRLASTYLLIILLMSIGFSFVFYHTSSQQLGRQIPPDSYFDLDHDNITSSSSSNTSSQGSTVKSVNHHDIDQFLQARIDEGRTQLQVRLLFLNVSALVVGAALSYWLARRTLQPIEAAMEAQVQFVSDASHELRTPLTAIQTSNEVALRKPGLTVAAARQVIERNNEDIQRLKQLSDGLLSLARQDTVDIVYEQLKLQDIVSEAITQVVPQAQTKRISVTDETADLRVLGNRAALAQVLVILLDNAVKYSAARSDVLIRSRQKGKVVYVDVIDKGIGIRASDMPHLFRRFYRADNARTSGARGGYGLGLSIAERIMQGHGGKISVTSTPGQGSVFTLKLTTI